MEKTKIMMHEHVETRLAAILMVIFCTGLTSFAQLMLKFGSERLAFNLAALLANTPLMLGAAAYVIGSFIFITALKYGELTILQPIFALSYIWVNLLSAQFLGESLNIFKWMGIISILFGVLLISWGRNR